RWLRCCMTRAAPRKACASRKLRRLKGMRVVQWIHGMRYREGPVLHYSRLRWYREITITYGATAHFIVPTGLRALARISVAGLDNVPATGPIILAANHFDNLDAYLLL